MSTMQNHRTSGSLFMSTLPCPSWCVTRHGVHLGEENWVHTGEPLLVADGIRAQIVMSVEPDTGNADGPYILIGGRDYTLAAARQFGSALIAAADSAAAACPADPSGGEDDPKR